MSSLVHLHKVKTQVLKALRKLSKRANGRIRYCDIINEVKTQMGYPNLDRSLVVAIKLALKYFCKIGFLMPTSSHFFFFNTILESRQALEESQDDSEAGPSHRTVNTDSTSGNAVESGDLSNKNSVEEPKPSTSKDILNEMTGMFNASMRLEPENKNNNAPAVGMEVDEEKQEEKKEEEVDIEKPEGSPK